MVQGCENYLEKYQPLFAQRQIQEILENVLSSGKEKWKLKKFVEQKAAAFTEKILSDHGAPDLQGVIDGLHDSLHQPSTHTDQHASAATGSAAVVGRGSTTHPPTASAEGSPAKTKAYESIDEKMIDGDGINGSYPSVKDGDISTNTRKYTSPLAAPAQNAHPADVGDMDTQIAVMVAQMVEERSAEFEEKLKYWKGEVDQSMVLRFNELNTSVLG